MFDEVEFPCPDCGRTNSVQSKAGSCSLIRYDVGRVPLNIAADVDGEVVECKCGKMIRLFLPFGPKITMMVS